MGSTQQDPIEAVDQLLHALTMDGRLGPKHIRVWANVMVRELGYSGSMIEEWLANVANALENLEEVQPGGEDGKG